MANTFEIVTALTIVAIGTILTLYFIVLQRKGWLKRDLTSSESYFLCPNSKCRRVFKEPVWMTDLSKTPPEAYQACPHCSTNLQISPSFPSEKDTTPTVLPTIIDTKKPEEKVYNIPKQDLPQTKVVVKEVSEPQFQTNVPKKPEKSRNHERPKTTTPIIEFRKETPAKSAQPTKKQDESQNSQRPRACTHYFGYVKTLPKNTSIPDECLWCPWIVDCLAGDQNARKVEA